MRRYGGVELFGHPDYEGANGAVQVSISVCSEDAVDPHDLCGILLDCVVDLVHQIHADAHLDDVPGQDQHEFPTAVVVQQIEQLKREGKLQ